MYNIDTVVLYHQWVKRFELNFNKFRKNFPLDGQVRQAKFNLMLTVHSAYQNPRFLNQLHWLKKVLNKWMSIWVIGLVGILDNYQLSVTLRGAASFENMSCRFDCLLSKLWREWWYHIIFNIMVLYLDVHVLYKMINRVI